MFSPVSCCVVLSLSAVVLSSSDPYNNNLGQVLFSHVLFRHGNRMPLEFYPNDQYQDPSNWPFGVAQLTDVGKRQEYELGRWLRRRYNHMLSNHYNVSEIYIQSTDLDRTLMSAQCSMGGLYGPGDSQDPATAWQPVPVHTIPVQTDNLLGATSTCPCAAYTAEVHRAMALPEVQALQKKFEVMYDYVTNHTGREVRDFDTAIKIYDVLAIEEQHNMSLPKWAYAVYPEPLKEAGLYSFVFPTWTTLMQRLKVGPLLKEMVEHFQAKRAGMLSPDRNLWVYSAHDSTVAALLNTFKVFDIHFPPYAACLVLELRLIKEEYFVTLFYRNNTAEEPQLLPIKTCSTVCPLEQFVSLVQPLLPSDWNQECQLPSTTADKFIWLTITAVSGVIGCVMLFLLTIHCLKKKTPSRKYFTMSSPFVTTLEPKYLYPLPK